MRPLPALMLLGLTACEVAELSLDLDSGSRCVAIALETVDEALLPGWQIAAMVAERVEGEGAWIVAGDPEGRTTLQPWPSGPGLDLSGLGEAAEFDLQPGLNEDESWLVLDRPARVRVWRLGSSARGELEEVPGLAEFPGPGDWTRRLLFVGDTPHLLAMPVTAGEGALRFQVAAIDPWTLTLGPAWPIDFVEGCWGEVPCPNFEFHGQSIAMLGVTAAGSMRGGAVLLGLGLPEGFPSGRDGFLTTLSLYVDEAGSAPVMRREDLGLIGGSGASRGVQGQLATDARSLFSVHRVVPVDAQPDEHLLSVIDLDSGLVSGRPALRTVGMLLQLGARAVVGVFAPGRLSLAPLDGDRIDTAAIGSIELDPDARVTSAGREQLLVRPAVGPARRVRARCVPAE